MIRGVCHGGPLDGMIWESRYPNGFILANRPAVEAIIYDYDAESRNFHASTVDGTMVRVENIARRRAGPENGYDVWTYDWERMGPWPR